MIMILLLVKLFQIKIKKNKYKYIDSSTSIRKNEKGFIDNNYVNNNSEGYKIM